MTEAILGIIAAAALLIVLVFGEGLKEPWWDGQ